MKISISKGLLNLALTAIMTLTATATGSAADGLHPGRMYLSGADAGHPARWGFYCSDGSRSGVNDSINVPCNWELQGFGDFTYGRWYKVKGAKPSAESGVYTLDFDLPADAEGQVVNIVFDGVMTDCTVKVNGVQAGEKHQGGFYRFKRDISGLVKPGERNRLEVRVDKHSSNKSINAAERRADWWLYGGIYRPVWLEILPAAHISHVVFDPRHDGRLTARVELAGEKKGGSVKVRVDGFDKELTATFGKDDSVVTLEGIFPDVKPWSPETPSLYKVTVDLIDPDGVTTQSLNERVGFRTVELRPRDGFYLNDHKIILKGVNRHSFSTMGGRAVSREQNVDDARLIKQMNMNAVRGHYPPDEAFLYACDSLGLLYMDELAGWQDGYDNEVGPVLLKEMIERDLNHPSVVIWSNGNEGGWNRSLDSLFAAHDMLQRRHVVHPWADFNDVDTHHYPTYLTGVGRLTNGYKVFMPTEFMHSMYDQGGGAGLRDFWDRWKTNPMFAGGFIWAFCDEAPARMDLDGHLDSDGSNAPDGVLGPRREREGSFYAIREQWCPVQIKPLLITEGWNGRFLVTNEHLFTTLDECSMKYWVVKNQPPALGVDVEPVVVAWGEVTLPPAQPGETMTAVVDMPDNFGEGDLLRLAAYSPQGEAIGEWSYPIRLVGDYYDRYMAGAATMKPGSKKSRVTVADKDGSFVLSSARVKVRFDKTTGELSEIRADGRVVPLTDGPRAVGMKMKYEPGLSAIRVDGDDAVYCARYKGGVDSIVWRLTPAGLLHMDALLLNRAGGGGGFDDAFMDTEVYNLGLAFSFPDSVCTGMTWFGAGPYRVWKNRMAGATVDTWHKDYNNTVTGETYDNLVYPEFKGYHGRMYWATLENVAAPVTVYSRRDGLFYHVFTPDEPVAAEGKTMPAFPAEGNLSFLLDIPAIRSFKPIEQQGPNSQPGNIRIKKGDEGLHIDLTFDFLK